MNRERSIRKVIRPITVLPIVVIAWVVWPTYSHMNWRAGEPALHALPAFFLGSQVLVALGAAARTLQGCHRRGARWLISREAGRLALLCLGVTVTILALFYNIELWRGKYAYARVTQQADALREPLDLQALKPNPIPEEENFALAKSFAPLLTMSEDTGNLAGNRAPNHLGQLDELTRRAQRFILKDEHPPPWMRGFTRPFADDDPATTTPDERAVRILDGLAPLETLLADVQQTSRRPKCQFPWASVNPLFSDRYASTDKVLIGLLLVLEERALARLRTERPTPACDDIQTGLRIVSHLQRRPALFYTVPRAQAVARLFQPVWEALAEERFTASQLAELQSQVESMDPLDSLADRLRFQILTHTDLIESIIPTGKAAGSGTPPAEDEAAFRWIRAIYPRGWSLQDQATFHAFHFELLKTLSSPGRRPTLREANVIHRLIRGSSDPCFAVFLVPKAVQMAQDNFESLQLEQTTLTLAQGALALERYRLAEGRYPNELSELVPQYLKMIPRDPSNGEPLRYRPAPPGRFVLYSVGMDGLDNKGTPPTLESRTGPIREPSGWDWTWQHPVALKRE